MVDARKAYEIIKKKSHLPVAFMVDYGDHYVFGLKNDKNKFAASTYEAVDKSNGNVSNFIVDDFTEFFRLVNTKFIDVSEFE